MQIFKRRIGSDRFLAAAAAVLFAAPACMLFAVPVYAEDYWSTTNLNIREAPEGRVIGSYQPGDHVNVTDASGEWYRTDLGYVASKYLTADPAEAAAADSSSSVEASRGEALFYAESEFPLIWNEEGLEITITRETGYNSVWYAAHVILDDPDRLQTMFPGGSWGGHATATAANLEVGGSILMINGDFRDPTNAQHLGIVRGGVIINDQPMKKASIGITWEGDLVSTKRKTVQEVLAMGVRDTLSFGPFLVKKGKAVSHSSQEIHPRTFIGQVRRKDDRKEYWFIVADGRWNGYSDGLTHDAMSAILEEKGCYLGFNLDGGGSSVMLFQGRVVNRPSEGEQRENADYLYIK